MKKTVFYCVAAAFLVFTVIAVYYPYGKASPVIEAEEDEAPAVISLSVAPASGAGEYRATVSVSGNPGIAGYEMALHFDWEKLTPVEITGGILSGMLTSNLATTPLEERPEMRHVSAVWMNDTARAGNGVMFSVLFRGKPGASGLGQIELVPALVRNEGREQINFELSSNPVQFSLSAHHAPIEGGLAFAVEEVAAARDGGEGLDISFGDEASVRFTAEALSGILGAGSGDISVYAGKADRARLSAAQIETVGGGAVYEFSVENGRTQVTSFNGDAYVRLRYEPVDSGESPAVWRVYSNGRKEEIIGSGYNAEEGIITFTTGRASVFIIEDNGGG